MALLPSYLLASLRLILPRRRSIVYCKARSAREGLSRVSVSKVYDILYLALRFSPTRNSPDPCTVYGNEMAVTCVAVRWVMTNVYKRPVTVVGRGSKGARFVRFTGTHRDALPLRTGRDRCSKMC